MQKAPYRSGPFSNPNESFTVAAPLQEGLPTGGGLGGMKRLQLQQSGGMPNGPGKVGQGNTGIVPPKATPSKVAPAGYEQPRPASFNQRLSTLSSPNFPRRRGQG